MRSSKTHGLVALVVAAALVAAGCIASTGKTARLDADQGSGDVVIELVLENGELTAASAWWAQPDEPVPEGPTDTSSGLEAIVMKNDVELDRQPLTGSAERAELVWRSSRLDAVATPGDEFDVTVVNATSGASVASFSVQIDT